MTDREVTAQRRMHDAAQKIAELLDEGDRGLRLDDACVDWRAASVEYTRACKLRAMLENCEYLATMGGVRARLARGRK